MQFVVCFLDVAAPDRCCGSSQTKPKSLFFVRVWPFFFRTDQKLRCVVVGR